MEQSSISKFVNHLSFKVDPCELNKAITKLKEGLIMEQFDNPPKYIVTRSQPAMEQNDFMGNWIRLEDYYKLLLAYKELTKEPEQQSNKEENS